MMNADEKNSPAFFYCRPVFIYVYLWFNSDMTIHTLNWVSPFHPGGTHETLSRINIILGFRL